MLPNIIIREMAISEQGLVRAFFKRCLGFLDLLVFSIVFTDIVKSIKKQQGCCLIALQNDVIVGTMSLRMLDYGRQKVGLIDAVASDKAIRGRGVASAMLTKAMEWFDARGYHDMYATVDRYNSPSWNMFIHAGFSPYEFPNHVKDFGRRFLKLWFDEGFVFGLGTFFLKKTINDKGVKPKEAPGILHLFAACVGYSLLWWIIVLKAGIVSMDAFVAIIVVASASLAVAELGHVVVARARGLQTCFKAWSSGLWFMLALGLVGLVYPSYGSTYIKQEDWSYTRNRRDAGIIYIAGPIVNVIVAITCHVLSIIITAGTWQIVFVLGFNMNTWLAIFNVLPIKSAGGVPFDGYKIFSWNKAAWGLVTACVACVFIMPFVI
ncbi:MAG: GNAT family N-acetyltransferase [Candidatus Sigynarchaeota archaeon]